MPRWRATAFAVVQLSPVSMTTRMPCSLSAASASGVDGLTGSAMAKIAATRPSTPMKIAVAPSSRSRSASSASGATSTPCSARNFALPSGMRLPSTTPSAPLPVGESKSATGAVAIPRSSAARTMASASGCSLARSTLAASRSASSSLKPAAGTMAVTAGRPSVRVPVLSTMMVLTFSIFSSASAFLISTPACAPRPTPTMIDIGVANPNAQGQAMISTDTAAIRPKEKRGSGPQIDQAMKARIAITITAGTNQPDTWSARRWIGARLRCASATSWTICDNMVSRPTFRASITSAPDWFMVPPMADAPAALVTGIDSPVTIDSSTALRPSSTSPSTGTFSPGRTRRRSPTCTLSSGTSSSMPSSRMIRAVLGARSSSARMAPLVLSRARSSNTCPSSTSTVMTAAASK